MNTNTIKFYKDNNIDITKTRLELSDVIYLVNKLAPNINTNNPEIIKFLETLRKDYPPANYFRKSISEKYGRVKSVVSEEYWTSRGHSVDIAKQRIKNAQKDRASTNSPYYYIKRGYSVDEAETLAKTEQLRRGAKANESLSKLQRRQNSVLCNEYWMLKGYSKEDSKIKVAEYQRANGKQAIGKIPVVSRNTRIEYWVNKGYSVEDAELLLRNRQATFSYKKCIEQYGEDLGKTIFNTRQKLWQSTLNAKSQEELDSINSRKSNRSKFLYLSELRNTFGAFYIIRLTDDHIKIGITTKQTLEQRYSINELIGKEIIVFKQCSLYTAFLYEQFFKQWLKRGKIQKRDKIGSFGWTETFIVTASDITSICEMLQYDIEYFEKDLTLNDNFIFGLGMQDRKNIGNPTVIG